LVAVIVPGVLAVPGAISKTLEELLVEHVAKKERKWPNHLQQLSNLEP
jgi:hypothetical protein